MSNIKSCNLDDDNNDDDDDDDDVGERVFWMILSNHFQSWPPLSGPDYEPGSPEWETVTKPTEPRIVSRTQNSTTSKGIPQEQR
jgi:hypothetical protein